MMKLWKVTGDGKGAGLIVATDADEACMFCEREAAGIFNIKVFTARAATLAETREWYEETVGYDPMAETPPMAEAEFLALASEYMQEM